jgi:hypothetical protein
MGAAEDPGTESAGFDDINCQFDKGDDDMDEDVLLP